MKKLLESYNRIMEIVSVVTGYISPLNCGIEEIINEAWIVSGDNLFVEVNGDAIMSYDIAQSDNGILFVGIDTEDKENIYYFVLIEDEFGSLTAFILLNKNKNNKLIQKYAKG